MGLVLGPIGRVDCLSLFLLFVLWFSSSPRGYTVFQLVTPFGDLLAVLTP